MRFWEGGVVYIRNQTLPFVDVLVNVIRLDIVGAGR